MARNNGGRLNRLNKLAGEPDEPDGTIVLPPDAYRDDAGNIRLPDGSPNTIPTLKEGRPARKIVVGVDPADLV